VICMHKGAPILRSALTGELRLELTYRDPFAKERADELSTAADYHTSESLQLTTHTWHPELRPEPPAFPKST
jgi:hypothetical protein